MVVDEGWFRAAETVPFEMFGQSLVGTFVLPFVVSLLICALNIATGRWHGTYSYDLDIYGVQKVHQTVVPRTGGLALYFGVVAVPVAWMAGFCVSASSEDAGRFACKLLVVALPAFIAGIVEDLTKRVSVRTRLCSIVSSACLAAGLLEARLPRLDIWGLDGLLGLLPVSMAITVFMVAGVTNSINIIDGFHGVAGSAVAIVLSGIGYLAITAGDVLVAHLALAGVGATIGFLMFNYPTGRLFMGDGGAYFLGFWSAELAVLTIARNPGVNAWQILAIFAYPVIEVLFSIYRRKILKSLPIGAPDRMHLHSLFYRRVTRLRLRRDAYPWLCNAGVACFVAAWLVVATLAAILVGDRVSMAVLLVLVQSLAYVAVYMRLIRGHWGRCRSLVVLLGLRPQRRSGPA